MQFFTIVVSSLAALGVQAAGGIPSNLVRERALELNTRAQGTCGIDELCHVSGQKKRCQIGECNEGERCDDDANIVSCGDDNSL